jgi:hypothetical protein
LIGVTTNSIRTVGDRRQGILPKHDRLSEDEFMANPNRRYIQPAWFTRHLHNPVVQALTKIGVSFWGSRILEVRGRKSGEWRSEPVNLLDLGGTDYLWCRSVARVAESPPRGPNQARPSLQPAQGNKVELRGFEPLTP